MNIYKLASFALLGGIGLTSFELNACIRADSEELPPLDSRPVLIRQNAQIPITFEDREVSDEEQDLGSTTPSLLERFERRADAYLAKKDKRKTARHYKEVPAIENEKLESKGFSALTASRDYWFRESTQKHHCRKYKKEAQERAKVFQAEIDKRFPQTTDTETTFSPKHHVKKAFSIGRQTRRAAKEAFWTQDSE